MFFPDFDHIELCVEEPEESALFSLSTLGFRVLAEAGPETGLEGQRCLVLRQGAWCCGSPPRWSPTAPWPGSCGGMGTG